jgi:hypothetical protein
VAGKGTVSGSTVAAAGVAGSGTAKDVTGTAAGKTGAGESTGPVGAGTATTGTTGTTGGAAGTAHAGTAATAAKKPAAEEGEGAGGEREGAPGGTQEGAVAGKGTAPQGEAGAGVGRGTQPGDPKLAEIVAKLGLPPSNVNRAAEKAVVDAVRLDQLVSRATDAQKILLRTLAADSRDGVYVVPEPAWVEMILSATSGLTEEELQVLAELEWEPGRTTIEELRKAIQAAIAARRRAARTEKERKKEAPRAGPKAQEPPGGGKPQDEKAGKDEARKAAEGKGGGRAKAARKARLSATPRDKIVAALSKLPWDRIAPGGVVYQENPKPGLVAGKTPAGTRFGALATFDRKKAGKQVRVIVKESSAIVLLDDAQPGEALTFTAEGGVQIFEFIEGTSKGEAINDGSLFVNLIVDLE